MVGKIYKLPEEIFLGILAGVVFAFSAWGFDAIALAGSNGVLPWLKLVIGLIPSIFIFVGLGFLSAKLPNLVLKLILWPSSAFVLGWLVTRVNFYIYPRAFVLLKPSLSGALHYVVPDTISQRLFVITVMSGIFLLVGGLLMESTLEALRFARSFVSSLIAILFWLFFFLGAGYVTDNNYNEMLREPVVVLNEKLDSVGKIDLNTASEWTKQMVKRYTQLNVDLDGNRKLVISEFDESFTLVKILVDFGEKWAECVVMSGHVSNCVLVENLNF